MGYFIAAHSLCFRSILFFSANVKLNSWSWKREIVLVRFKLGIRVWYFWKITKPFGLEMWLHWGAKNRPQNSSLCPLLAPSTKPPSQCVSPAPHNQSWHKARFVALRALEPECANNLSLVGARVTAEAKEGTRKVPLSAKHPEWEGLFWLKRWQKFKQSSPV